MVWLGCTWASAVFAQGVVGVDPTGRSGDTPRLPQDAPSGSSPPPTFTLPSLPTVSPRDHGSTLRFLVREIRITGNTVFSAEELGQVTAPYVNREVSSDELEDVRLALSRWYAERGYVNSGAVLPDQTIQDGIVTVHIVEGTLTQVEIEGNRWTRSRYFEDRLSLRRGQPLNVNTMSEQLRLLQQDERVAQLHAELRPGIKPGEGILRVRVHEEQPYSLIVGFNNYQSPTVGAERGILAFAHRNVTGNGDEFRLTSGQSSGVRPQIDTSYSFPITSQNTTIALNFRRNDFTVIEAPFDPLDIASESTIYGISLRHPLFRTVQREIAVAVTGEHLRNVTFLAGNRFSFSSGARNGRSKVSVLRVATEWTERTEEQVVALRSRFSIGVDVFGATSNRSGLADGQFFSWLGQLQWARRWQSWNVHTIARLDVQLTPNPLLSLEQIAAGGRYSVRGYRENQLVRDNGLISSFEVRVPIVRNAAWADTLEFAPFVDAGHAWNRKGPTPNRSTLVSVGIGLRWALTLPQPWRWRPELEIYWGHALRDVRTAGGDLQDHGLHMQLLLPVL